MGKVDKQKLIEMIAGGSTKAAAAEWFGVSPQYIGKLCKQWRVNVAKAVVPNAPKFVEKKDTATDHLMFLAQKAKNELVWIEKTVAPENDAEYREWQNQKLKFAAEMRKLITAMADTGYKLFHANEVSEVLRIMDEEIGRESIECQKRIRDRIRGRQNIRFAGGFN